MSGNWKKGITGVKLWNTSYPPERWAKERKVMGEK